MSLPTVPSVHSQPLTPLSRLFNLLREDSRDFWVLILYTILAGMLSLAVPLAAQALVNTIAAGVFIQPLVVLTLLLFVGLLFAGVLRALQFYLVEIMQQRVFAKVALRLASHLPKIQHFSLIAKYPPELVNRFFDVIKIQKTLSKLLLEGPAASLQILVGLVLMAFYSPILLAFDAFIIAFVCFIAFVLGIGGLRTSIQESAEKYRVAGWLEDVARCQISLKVDGMAQYLIQKTDQYVLKYIYARRSHFRVLFRQVIGNYFFQAMASAGILGIGGWLVINRQLTLGQLVASELIVLQVLSALEKLIALFQEYYDVLASLDKIGQVTDLPLERTSGVEAPQLTQGASLVCSNLQFGYLPHIKVLDCLNLSLQPGEHISLVGASGAGKTTLAFMICGLLEPTVGRVEINGMDVRDISLESLRNTVALVRDANEIFEGTIEDNITVGREQITYQDVLWALEMTCLSSEVGDLAEGLKTHLISSGRNLSRGQQQRLMIARAIVDRPQLLILDEAFTGIDEKTKLEILDALYAPINTWTIIDISHDPEVVIRSGKIHVMSRGAICETGTAVELALNDQSEFARLFPDMASRVRSKSRRRTQ